MNGLVIRSFSSVKVKVLLRELHIDHHPRFFLWAQGGKYSDLYKAKMNVLRYLRIDLCPRRRTHDLALKHAAPRPTGTLARLAKSRRTYLPTAHTRNDVRFRGCVLGSNPWLESVARICLRLQPLESSLGRVPQATRRRTRETMFVFAAVCLARICLRLQPLESSLGRVPQATRRRLQINFVNRIVSVAEDCLSPERTFHG